ncbi:unnamed protein product, partial [Didymodactylos carnosus]
MSDVSTNISSHSNDHITTSAEITDAIRSCLYDIVCEVSMNISRSPVNLTDITGQSDAPQDGAMDHESSCDVGKHLHAYPDEEWFKLHRNGNNGSSRLHEWTIFDSPRCIKEENHPVFKTKSAATTVNSKMCGSMFGMAIGDALGAHVEFRPHSYLVEHPVRDLQGGGTWGLEK